MEGGHRLALVVLSITLTKCSTRSSRRLPPGCVRPLKVGGADQPPVQAATLVCRAGGQSWGPGPLPPGSCSTRPMQMLSGIGTLLRFSFTMRG